MMNDSQDIIQQESVQLHNQRLSDEKREEKYQKIQHSFSQQDPHFIRRNSHHLITALIFIVALLIFWIYLIRQQQQRQSSQVKEKFRLMKIKQNRLQSSIERQFILIKLLQNPNSINKFKTKIEAIDPLFINEKGLSASQFIYQDENQRKRRNSFQKQRQDFIDEKQINEIKLAKFNIVLDKASYIQSLEANEKDWLRLDQKFGLKRQKQLSMCVVTPGYNNRANFRIQYNLNSIFTQNYSNFKAVIIDDASIDGSGQLYRRYFQFFNLTQNTNKLSFIQNPARVGNMANYYRTIRQDCINQEIIVTVDADDELIGRNILQVLNAVYQSQQLGVVYSNFFWYQQNVKIELGFTEQYTSEQIRNQLYRNIDLKFSHLRSFKKELFLEINPIDFKNTQGEFYRISADIAMYYPMLELACGKIIRLNQTQYLYNIGTGLNDYIKGNGQLQSIVARQIQGKKKYKCSPKYERYQN